MLSHFHILSQGFQLGPHGYWGPDHSLWWDRPGHHGMLSSMPGLGPLDVRALFPSVVTSIASADIATCLGGHHPLLRNTVVTHLACHLPREVPLDRVALAASWPIAELGAFLLTLLLWNLAQRSDQELRGGCRNPNPCVWHGMGPRASRAPGRKFCWPGH